MASSSDSNNASDESSRIEPHFPDPNEISMNNYVGESSSSSLFLSKGNNAGPLMRKNRKRKAIMKLKCPLPPRQRKSFSAPKVSRVSLSLDEAIEYELIYGRKLDPNLDVKYVRRTISNRISAQRSRLKKMQHVVDLEKIVRELEVKVSTLTPKLEDFLEQKKILEIENVSLRTQVDIRAAESRISEDRLEAKRRELMELKKLHKPPSTSNFNSGAHMQISLLQMNMVPEVEMQVSQFEMNMVPEVEMQVSQLQMLAEFDQMQVPGEVEMHVPEVEMMQVSASDKVRPKPYSIEFYQERLMQMEMNQFINQELMNLASALPPPQPEHDLLMELEIDDDMNDLEIDQYLNLDGIDLLHPTDL